MTLSLMCNFGFFFFQRKVSKLNNRKGGPSGRKSQHGVSESPRHPETRTAEPDEAREKQMFTLGVPWRNASQISHFSPKRWVCPWCTQCLLCTYGQWFHHSGTATSTVRMSVKHCLTSFWVFFHFVLFHYSVVGLTSVCMRAGTHVCLQVHLQMEVRYQLWLLFPRNHLHRIFIFLFLSFSLFFNLFSFKSGLFCLVLLILLYWLASEAWDPADSYLPRVGMTRVCITSSGFYLGVRDGAQVLTLGQVLYKLSHLPSSNLFILILKQWLFYLSF